MQLVVHQVVQLHHVHNAHSDFAVEWLTIAAVIQSGLSQLWKASFFQKLPNLFLLGAIKYWTGHMEALSVVGNQALEFGFIRLVKVLLEFPLGVKSTELRLYSLLALVFLQ